MTNDTISQNNNSPAYKSTVVRALLQVNPSVFIHFDGRKAGVVAPVGLLTQYHAVFQVGYDMPVPIPDLTFDDEGMKCTLSFKGRPMLCMVPWSAVWAVAGEDGRGMIWDQEMPPEAREEAAREQQKREQKPSGTVVSIASAKGERKPTKRSTTKTERPPYLRVVK